MRILRLSAAALAAALLGSAPLVAQDSTTKRDTVTARDTTAKRDTVTARDTSAARDTVTMLDSAAVHGSIAAPDTTAPMAPVASNQQMPPPGTVLPIDGVVAVVGTSRFCAPTSRSASPHAHGRTMPRTPSSKRA